MFHYSALTMDEYCRHLKDNLDSEFNLGQERFTGFVWGRFFCITHHCAREWNRRITSEMNTAIGFVKETENGCKSRYFTLRGILRPQSLLAYTLFCVVCFLLSFIDSLSAPPLSIVIPTSLGITLFVAAINAVQVCMTENGKAGYELLQNLLRNPSNPYTANKEL